MYLSPSSYPSLLLYTNPSLLSLPGPEEGTGIDICQQAGPQGLNVGSGTLATSEPHVYQRPWLARAGLLCSYRGGVSKEEKEEECSKHFFTSLE